MLQLGCALSVNSCLAIVYDGLPHTIVFHQEFIIVLYFGAKKIVWGGGGWDGVGGAYPPREPLGVPVPET